MSSSRLFSWAIAAGAAIAVNAAPAARPVSVLRKVSNMDCLPVSLIAEFHSVGTVYMILDI
jgi:hypothetical protein